MTFIRHYCKYEIFHKKESEILGFPVLFLGQSRVPGFHQLAEHDGCNGVNQCSNDGRTDDCRGIDTAILLAIGNNTYGDELQGGNIDDKEGAHFIAGCFDFVQFAGIVW